MAIGWASRAASICPEADGAHYKPYNLVHKELFRKQLYRRLRLITSRKKLITSSRTDYSQFLWHHLEENMITDKAVPSILNNPWKRLRVLYLRT